MRPRRRQKGFVLAATMIGVFLFIAAAAAAVLIWKARSANAERASLVQQQAHDMQAAAKALQRYMDWAGGTWAEGVLQQIPWSTLADEHLPASVGSYMGETGVTPWLQAYAVAAMRGSDGVLRGVIYDTGEPGGAALTASGIKADEMLLVKSAIAGAIAAEGDVAATLAAGQTIAAGAGQGFAMDLAPWIATPPDHAAAAVLVGFPELTAARLDDNDDDNPEIERGECRVLTASRYGGTASCPSGTQQVAEWPHCGRMNTDPASAAPFWIAYPTSYGPVVLGQKIAYAHTRIGQFCIFLGACHPTLGGVSYVSREQHELVVFLNAAPVAQYQCASTTYGLWNQSADQCIADSHQWWSGEGRCQIIQERDNTHGNDVLCCR